MAAWNWSNYKLREQETARMKADGKNKEYADLIRNAEGLFGLRLLSDWCRDNGYETWADWWVNGVPPI